jgi:hypothetical protein
MSTVKKIQDSTLILMDAERKAREAGCEELAEYLKSRRLNMGYETEQDAIDYLRKYKDMDNVRVGMLFSRQLSYLQPGWDLLRDELDAYYQDLSDRDEIFPKVVDDGCVLGTLHAYALSKGDFADELLPRTDLWYGSFFSCLMRLHPEWSVSLSKIEDGNKYRNHYDRESVLIPFASRESFFKGVGFDFTSSSGSRGCRLEWSCGGVTFLMDNPETYGKSRAVFCPAYYKYKDISTFEEISSIYGFTLLCDMIRYIDGLMKGHFLGTIDKIHLGTYDPRQGSAVNKDIKNEVLDILEGKNEDCL